MDIIDIDSTSLYKFKIGASTYLLNPKEGARLINWNISLADGSVRDVIYWNENSPLTGRDFSSALGGMYILFPFAGASFVDGKRDLYKAENGDVLPMKYNGYAVDGEFKEVFHSDNDIRLQFVQNDEVKKAYPYDYDFFVHFIFKELSFTCELIVQNNGSQRMPIGAGFNPFFNIPWISGTSKNDYRFLTDAKKAFDYNSADGSMLQSSLFKCSFGDESMSAKIWKSLKTGIVKFGPKNGEEDITIKIESAGKPNVGTTLATWSKTEDDNYHCVATYMSEPNSASKPVVFVEPDCSKSFSIEISLI